MLSRNLKLASLMKLGASLTVASALAPTVAAAQEATPQINSGDTAFILIATALVLVMTPGLAFFYAGLVRRKNAVATLFQNYSALAVVGLAWLVVGYSLSFSEGSAFIGGMSNFMFNGIGQAPNGTIPQVLFATYQGMFAVITPVLICGAICERIRFKGWLAFSVLWSLAVYAPVCHWVWGGGWLAKAGALDFAGGFVVHMTAGFSAIVAAILLGRGKAFGTPAQPQNIGMVLLGTSLLFFGWIGFNAGSALAANGAAAQALATTFFAAAAAFTSWMAMDWMRGKPSLIGACVGTVAGLVAITPGAGFVTVQSAVIIGLLAGVVCNVVAVAVRNKFKIDDTLDVFACHGVGGLLGVICTGLFATTTVNPAGAEGLFNGSMSLFTANLTGAGAVAVYSIVVSAVLVKLVDAVVGFRANELDQQRGLDHSEHDEMIEREAA